MVKRATIKDIARMADVSPTAVSMALNNRAGVSESTREKIRQIAADLNYRPNGLAKSLISRRSFSIGLIITNIADHFYPELAQGVEETAHERGYRLILCNTNRELDEEKRAIDMLRANGVDGIIITTAPMDDPHIGQLVAERYPFILINRMVRQPELNNKVDYVVLDNYAGGYIGAKHLAQLGHKRIAVIAGAMNTSTAFDRTEGTRQALDELGIALAQDMIAECGYVREEAYNAAKRFLSSKTRPTAFFAQDDHMAMGVREAVLGEGLNIPQDIALMGFDNAEIGGFTGIDLTTISQKKYVMGSLGAKILIDKIEGQSDDMVNKVVLEAKLIIRKSCGHYLNVGRP